jgi:ABC-type branched-subunit amino acid transport system substrate-binding protein
MGFELGFASVWRGRSPDLGIVYDNDTTGNPLAASRAAGRLISNGSIGLFGFPGSHDSLLAAKVALNAGVVAVFPGCNHSDLANFGPYVLTTGYHMSFEVRSMLDFAQKNLRLRHLLVVIDSRSAPSSDQEQYFLAERARLAAAGVRIAIASLGEKRRFSSEIMSSIKKGDFDGILVTSYPNQSLDLIGQLSSEGIGLPLVAGSSWGTVNPDLFGRFFASRTGKSYIMSTWHRESGLAKDRFDVPFQRKFGRPPNFESAFGFDLGVIAGTLVKRNPRAASASDFRKSFDRNRCFEGLTIGKLCFPPTGGHVVRPVYFFEVVKGVQLRLVAEKR